MLGIFTRIFGEWLKQLLYIILHIKLLLKICHYFVTTQIGYQSRLFNVVNDNDILICH